MSAVVHDVDLWFSTAGRWAAVSTWSEVSATHAVPLSLSCSANHNASTLLFVYHRRRRQHRATLIGRLLRRMRTQPMRPHCRESNFTNKLLCFFFVFFSALHWMAFLLLRPHRTRFRWSTFRKSWRYGFCCKLSRVRN